MRPAFSPCGWCTLCGVVILRSKGFAMRVCVFGSSSLNLDAVYVDAAFELGRTLAKHGHGIVFGGYDVGLMGAVAHGVAAEGGRIKPSTFLPSTSSVTVSSARSPPFAISR